MRKDPNNGPDQNDDSLPRTKILRGRRNFERLFEKSTVLSSKSLQLRYRLYQDPSEGCLIAFIAPKKRIRSAAKRNRVKRLLREVYRKNQHYFLNTRAGKDFGMHAAFIAGDESLSYSQIEQSMVALLEQAGSKIQAFYNRSNDGKQASTETQ